MSSQKMILVLFEFSKINTMCLKQVCVSNISKEEIGFSQKRLCKDVAENSEDIYGGQLCNSSQPLFAAKFSILDICRGHCYASVKASNAFLNCIMFGTFTQSWRIKRLNFCQITAIIIYSFLFQEGFWLYSVLVRILLKATCFRHRHVTNGM